MHEMSLAIEVLKIAEKNAVESGANEITVIELDVGQMAGVMIHALEFCLEAAKNDTMAESAEIVIHKIDSIGECPNCESRFPVESQFSKCPQCNDHYLKIVAGDDLKVRAIEVENKSYV